MSESLRTRPARCAACLSLACEQAARGGGGANRWSRDGRSLFILQNESQRYSLALNWTRELERRMRAVR